MTFSLPSPSSLLKLPDSLVPVLPLNSSPDLCSDNKKMAEAGTRARLEIRCAHQMLYNNQLLFILERPIS